MEIKQFEGLGQLITSSHLDADPRPLSADHLDDFVENLNRIHENHMRGYAEKCRVLREAIRKEEEEMWRSSNPSSQS